MHGFPVAEPGFGLCEIDFAINAVRLLASLTSSGPHWCTEWPCCVQHAMPWHYCLACYPGFKWFCWIIQRLAFFRTSLTRGHHIQLKSSLNCWSTEILISFGSTEGCSKCKIQISRFKLELLSPQINFFFLVASVYLLKKEFRQCQCQTQESILEAYPVDHGCALTTGPMCTNKKMQVLLQVC